MSINGDSYEEPDNSTLEGCLRMMRFAFLEFAKIHNTEVITNQVPNFYETYLPRYLLWEGPRVNVKNLFVNDFCQRHGNCAPVKQGSPNRAFVIYGSKGIGKSALLNYLLYQWILDEAEDVRNIKDFSLVLLIDAKSVTSDSPSKILCKKLEFDYFPKHMSTEGIYLGLKAAKILWLVDGFHEAKPAAKSFIRNILTRFKSSQMVITSDVSHEKEIKRLMALSRVKYVRLRLNPLTLDNWELMVPRLLSAKTRNAAMIRELGDKFILRTRATPILHPYDLGVAINTWLKIYYPYLRKKRKI
ncbi:uncharacterized protein LOC135223288 [Macrobrachium nipponense]|uniref:uncharacterized protein LOC135223288 n=1 Tax=Macrobrachium nipponense TaxID=159736 RepID=UPI0030C87D1F